jgi:hypothetical protein
LDLNLLFDTTEQARLANRLIWVAIALWKDHAAWAFDELAAFPHWLDAVTPVLPLHRDGLPEKEVCLDEVSDRQWG